MDIFFPLKPSYADIVTRRQGTSTAAGYTTSLNSGPITEHYNLNEICNLLTIMELLILNEFWTSVT